MKTANVEIASLKRTRERALVLLDALHAEMGEGNGVHPFDCYDRLGVIIAVLKEDQPTCST